MPNESIEIEISYTYSVQITSETSLGEVLSQIESVTRDAVAADLVPCDDESGRRLGSVVGISALPKDYETSTCGEGCRNISGGMTVYINNEGNADKAEVQCRAFDVTREAMGNFGSGINEIEFLDDGDGTDCSPTEDRGGVPASAVSMNAAAGGFPVAVVAANLVVVAVILLLAFLLLKRRRRRSNEGDIYSEEVSNLEGGIIEDELESSKDEKPGSALLVGGLGTGGALVASSISGFDGDHGDMYEKGYDLGIGASFVDTRDKKPATKLSPSEVILRARETGCEQKGELDSFCGGYFGGYAAGAAGRGFHDGYSSAAKGNRNAKSLPPRVLLKNAISLGYKDKDDIDAYCSGYGPGFLVGKNKKGGASKSSDNAIAYGSAYHDGFLDATRRKGAARLSDAELEGKARSIGLTEADAVAVYFAGYDAGFASGEAKRAATAAANAASSGYLDGYAAGASGIRKHTDLSPRELLKKSSAQGFINQEDVSGFCEGYRSGFMDAKVRTIRADRVVDAANAFGKGYHDGIINGTCKELDSEHSDAALKEKASTEGYVENEIVDAFCAGYCRGLKAGEAKRDATIASSAALRGFKDGYDMAANAATEPTPAESVKRARALGCIEPSEVEGYYIGCRAGFATSFATESGADDTSVSVTNGRALPTAFGTGYRGGFLDGLSIEQGVTLTDGKLKEEGRKLGYADKDSLHIFCRGHRLGFHAGEARRVATGTSNAFERGFLDGHSSTSGEMKSETSDVDDAGLMENARTLGFTDIEAIQGYSSGFRVGWKARKTKRWGTVGAGSASAAATRIANTYGRGYQFGYVVGAVGFDDTQARTQGASVEISDEEKEEIARATGIAKPEDISCFCDGFSAGSQAAKGRVEARLRSGGYGRDSTNEGSDAYSQGYEDGFAFGLSQLTGGNEYDDLEQKVKDAGLSRPVLEVRGLGLGYSSQKAIDNYCSGFWAGYIAVQGNGLGRRQLVQSLCNVHQCISSSCPICHKTNKQEPTFVSTGEHFIPEIEPSVAGDAQDGELK